MESWNDFWYLALITWLLYITWVIIISAANISFGVRVRYIKLLKHIFGKCAEKMMEQESERWNTGQESLNSPQIICREISGDYVDIEIAHYNPSESKNRFFLHDVTYFAKTGIEAIIQDDFTATVEIEEQPTWNLLARSKGKPQFVSTTISWLWFLGFTFRYFIFFTIRVPLFIFVLIAMTVGYPVLGTCLPKGRTRKKAYKIMNMWLYRIFMRSFNAVINYHDNKYRARRGGICVTNHTSPLDAFILGSDNTYAMIGQKQGGLIGYIQWLFDKVESHVWFERTSSNDRNAVLRTLTEHIQDPTKLPVLIFPEGVCINNTSILRFKKGCFELGATIYPVAIKYNPLFCNPLWSQDHMLVHIFDIMSSWALVCDVWYLPPEKIREDESGLDFANRIKSAIAKRGGLLEVQWDGMLKYTKPNTSLLEKNQLNYSKTIKIY